MREDTEENLSEKTLREHNICVACGGPKQLECIVCWNCFKYRDITPYKHFDGTFEQWIAALPKPIILKEQQEKQRQQAGAFIALPEDEKNATKTD